MRDDAVIERDLIEDARPGVVWLGDSMLLLRGDVAEDVARGLPVA
jgi:hypothetical protein